MQIERADGLAWRKVDEETFVVDLRRKWMYGLNRTGGLVWEAIVAGEGLEALVKMLCRAQGEGAAEAQVRPALLDFLRRLEELALLRPLSEELKAECVEESFDGRFPEAPRLIWHEELRAFAASCLIDYIRCPDGPAS